MTRPKQTRTNPLVVALLIGGVVLAALIGILLAEAAGRSEAAAHLPPGATATALAANVDGAPQLTAPANGSTLPDFQPKLGWTLPAGTTQYQLQVQAADGPGVNLIREPEGEFALPAPPEWYGLLPDMTYTWRVRASSATTALDENDEGWGPWSDAWAFRTPAVAVNAVAPQPPAADGPLALTWQLNNPAVWLVELQASADPSFNTDPSTARASVVWLVRHSGDSNPPNTYQVPADVAGQLGERFYWRVRPRIQGDGKPMGWSEPMAYSQPKRLIPIDGGSTINLTVGELFQVDFGTDVQWAIVLDPPGIVEELPTTGVAAMPRAFRAVAPGVTKLRATGDLPCRRSNPPCLAPTRLIEITLNVGNGAPAPAPPGQPGPGPSPSPQPPTGRPNPPAGKQYDLAPIESATVALAESQPPQYILTVVSALPNGCAMYDDMTVDRNGDVIVVKVYNLMPSDPATVCTQIYGHVTHSTNLGSDFTAGRTYTVQVNDKTVTFTAQ